MPGPDLSNLVFDKFKTRSECVTTGGIPSLANSPSLF
jgi:hypothetical protein